MAKQTFAPVNLFGITVQPTSPSGIAAILQGVAGQTANLLNLQDSSGNNRVTFDAVGNIATVALPVPGAPTLALASNASGVETGNHTYAVTFVNVNGETSSGATALIAVTTGNRQVNLSGIPLGPPGTTQRRLWRTTTGTTTPLKLLATLADNTTTTYSDTATDASLSGTTIPVVNMTLGWLTVGRLTVGAAALTYDGSNLAISTLDLGTLQCNTLSRLAGTAISINGASSGVALNGTTTITPNAAAGIGGIVKGVASQTGDLFQAQDSSAHAQFGIMNVGSGVAPIWALRVRATANAESMAQAHIIGAATGKAIQIVDDAGTSLGYIPLYA